MEKGPGTTKGMREGREGAVQAPVSRQRLLALLKQRQGEWISGQFLAGQTGMTRAAVWKQIGMLKEEGYDIEALTRQGYRLQRVPDKLFAPEIREGLNTRLLGRSEIRYLQTAVSTNQTAKEMASSGAPEGSLVVAEYQSRGRGRLRREWFSPAGSGIYASLILRPKLPPHEAARLVLLAAVAAAEAITETTGLAVSIKWPNDILAGGKKLAGILAELAMELDAVDYMVVGVGLNVNLDADAFPADLRPIATSIKAQTGRAFSRVAILRRFLERFDALYLGSREAGFEPVLSRWRSLTDMVGRRVRVETFAGGRLGTVEGFDGDGFLILRDEKGGTMRLVSGDIQFV